MALSERFPSRKVFVHSYRYPCHILLHMGSEHIRVTGKLHKKLLHKTQRFQYIQGGIWRLSCTCMKKQKKKGIRRMTKTTKEATEQKKNPP